MPILKEYKNRSGFHIRAWGPDSGYITYQVRSEAEPILRKVGFKHADELGWSVVNALRVAGLVHTGDQGVDPIETHVDFESDNEARALSGQQARELLSALENLSSIDSGTANEIRDILNMDSEDEDETNDRLSPSDLQQEINVRVAELIESGRCTSQLLSEPGTPTFHVGYYSRNGDGIIRIRTATGFKIEGSYAGAFFYFTADYDVGLYKIEVAVDTTIDWTTRGEIYRAIADFLPIVASSLRHKNVDPGDATVDPEITFEYL